MRTWMALGVALMLAGCSDAPGGAQDDLGVARAQAEGWHPAAALAGIVAIEARDPDAMDQGKPSNAALAEALLPGPDDEPGDGKAEAWGYVFIADDASYVVVMRSGAVAFSGEVDDEDLNVGDQAIGEWKLDAPAAAAKLEGEEDWNDLDMTVTALAQDENQPNPVWAFMAFGEEGFDGFFIVDAVTGEVTDVGAFMQG